ncbi:MAG TPA: hypothetical protein VH331_12485 [Allosphingosinicella sp.]|nr:hypothetical protein [Allosphingosinicella sp.]
MRAALLTATTIAVALAGCAKQPPKPQGYDIDLSQSAPRTRAGYEAAPDGDPVTVASVAIGKAEHPCGRVTKAVRLGDGSIAAICSNQEDFRITRIPAVGTVAMRCSEVRRMGIKGC